jgi:hypothetical protein
MSLHPILYVDTHIDLFEKDFYLKLFNDGPNSIYEIHISSMSRLFDSKINKVVSATHPKNLHKPIDWQYIQELKAKEKRKFQINYDELYNTYKMSVIIPRENKNDLIAIHLFYVTFRRKPDRTIYNIKKYLYLSIDQNDDKLIVIDLDKNYFQDFINLRKYLELYDNERLDK